MAAPPPSNSPSDPTPPDGSGDPKEPKLSDFFFLGTAAAIAVIAGGGIGYFIDSKLNTAPWFTFAGLAFGIVSAVLLVWQRVRQSL